MAIKESVNIPLGVDHSRLDGDLKKAEERITQALQRMDRAKKIQLEFESSLAEKKLSELKTLHQKLVQDFNKDLKLDVDSATLNATKDKINAVEKVFKNLNQELDKKPPVGNSLDKLAKIGMVATGLNQARQLLGEIGNAFKDMVNSGLEVEILRSNFQGTAQDLELFRMATAGTVSEANLIKLSNQATDLGVSLKDQPILFSMAEDAADKYGGSVEDNIQKVIYATEGNTKGLKSLGIQKEKFDEITKDLASAYGEEISKLDADTQKQIRLQAVLQASGLTIEDVKNKAADNKDKFEQMGIVVEEAKVKFGQLIASGLMPLISKLRELGPIGDTVLGGGSIAMSLMPLLVQVKELSLLQGILATKTAAATVALEGEAAAAGAANVVSGGFLTTLGLTAGILGAVAAGLYLYTEHMNKNTAAIRKNREEAEKRYPNAFNNGFGGKTYADTEEEKYNQRSGGNPLAWVKERIEKEKQEEAKVEGTNKKLLKRYEIQGKIDQLRNSQNLLVAGSAEDRRIEKQIAALEKKLNYTKGETDEAKKKAELEKKLTEGLNTLSISYYNSKKDLIKKEVQEFKDAGLDKVKIHEWELEQYRKLNEAFDKELAIKAQGLKGGTSIYDTLHPGGKPMGMTGIGDGKYTEEKPENTLTTQEMEDDIINFSDKTRTTFDSLYDGMNGFFDQMVIKSDWANSMLEQGILAFANTFIREVEAMIAKWVAFQVLRGAISFIPGLGPAAALIASPAIASANGGAYMGVGVNVKKLAGGGSMMVPPGYPNDSFGPFMVQSAELLKVYTPRQQAENMRDYSSFVAGMGRVESAMRILTENMIDNTVRDRSDSLQIGISGKLEGNDLLLSAQRAERRKKRYTGV